jgi:hypothetical protein
MPHFAVEQVCLKRNELYLRKEKQLQDAAEAKLAAAPEPVSKKAKTAGNLLHP